MTRQVTCVDDADSYGETLLWMATGARSAPKRELMQPRRLGSGCPKWLLLDSHLRRQEALSSEFRQRLAPSGVTAPELLAEELCSGVFAA